MSQKPIYQSFEQIKSRMLQGDKLRWVDGATIGRRVPANGMRLLFIGCDELDDDTAIELMDWVRSGVIKELPHKLSAKFIDYELP